MKHIEPTLSDVMNEIKRVSHKIDVKFETLSHRIDGLSLKFDELSSDFYQLSVDMKRKSVVYDRR